MDAVLRRLRDVESSPSEFDRTGTAHQDAASANEKSQANAEPFQAPFEDVALADAEGGMVLLHASGEANESAINLANVAIGHLDFLNVRAGVEASVGFYQAVDVGSEELSAAEESPVVHPVAEPVQPARPDNRYSHEGDGESSHKAAAALGASTLVGALLWCVRRTQPDGDRAADSSEEKNPRRRRAS